MGNLNYEPNPNYLAPELVVYDSRNYQTFNISQQEHALEYLFSNMEENQPLFLYIHGRALGGRNEGQYDNEPLESKNDAIPVLHDKYHAKVLMLHWPRRTRDGVCYPVATIHSPVGRAHAVRARHLMHGNVGQKSAARQFWYPLLYFMRITKLSFSLLWRNSPCATDVQKLPAALIFSPS